MSQITLNVVSKFKEGEGKITVQDANAENPAPSVIGHEGKISEKFTLSDTPGIENALKITLEGDGNGSAKECWFGLPAMFNYEFFPEAEEDKKGSIEIAQEGRQKFLKIPEGSPLNWKLKIKGKPRAPLSSLTGTDDTVKPGGGKDGEKSLPVVKDFETKANFKNAQMLREFLASVNKDVLTREDREKIVDQASVLIDKVYVHLDLKKARHAVDPIGSLNILRRDAVETVEGEDRFKLNDRAFHNRMISIFTGLRDIHTHYVLPRPYRDKVAFLPFLIEEYYEDEGGQRKYMVSKIFSGADKVVPDFEKGVDITHWNGIPMERAVELNGEQSAGSNEYAGHARGLEWMTIRPLKMTLPPDEDWVDITVEKDNRVHNLRFDWYVADYPSSDESGIDADDTLPANQEPPEFQGALGINVKTEIARRTKKGLFFGDINEPREIDAQVSITLKWSDTMADIFAFGTVKTGKNEKNRKYGYIRIYSFDVKDADAFANEFIRILKDELPQNGLIIDVRGNGGGLITAGEKILQVFTTKKIERVKFAFKSNRLMETLCRKNNWLKDWLVPLGIAIDNGTQFSKGFSLESDTDYLIEDNDYKYPGKVVLVTDALCYSTTDIFAAGFKDNKLGKILGTDKTTGGGGANVWTHKFLEKYLQDPSKIEALPGDELKNCEFRVAVRVAERFGENSHLPIEGLGVKPHFVHYMKRDDILKQNVKLIKKAVDMLDNWDQFPV